MNIRPELVPGAAGTRNCGGSGLGELTPLQLMLVTLVLMLEVEVTLLLMLEGDVLYGGGINDEAGDIKIGDTGVIGGGVIIMTSSVEGCGEGYGGGVNDEAGDIKLGDNGGGGIITTSS